MYVCVCNAVTDGDIRKAVRQGIDSMDGLRAELKVATCCGRCEDCARGIVERELTTLWCDDGPALVAI